MKKRDLRSVISEASRDGPAGGDCRDLLSIFFSLFANVSIILFYLLSCVGGEGASMASRISHGPDNLEGWLDEIYFYVYFNQLVYMFRTAIFVGKQGDYLTRTREPSGAQQNTF